MTQSDVIKEVDNAFADVPRPPVFIRETCFCEECCEHNETMCRVNRMALPFEDFGHLASDPICFASEAAFQYLMPGLVRLVFDHPDDYVQQFAYNLQPPGRIECLTSAQQRTIASVLEILILEHTATLDDNMVTDDVFHLLAILEQDTEKQARLPTQLEINPIPGDLGGEHAVKMFHGKSVTEAELLFRENSLFYQEDFMFMGPAAYAFYFPAAFSYLRSQYSVNDADFVSSMLATMESRVTGEYNDAQALGPAINTMLDFCLHALEHYELYDVDHEIHGDLRPRLRALAKHLGATTP